MIGTDDVQIRTLRDRGQTALEVAAMIQDFAGAAQHSLDISLYDLALHPDTHKVIADAIEGAAQRGVAVRLMLNSDHPGPIPVPPPPKLDATGQPMLQVPTHFVSGIPDLMHHKYIVRDGQAVWTGSTNWTDDSWTREENEILIVESASIAGAYTANFQGLWDDPVVAHSGRIKSDVAQLPNGWIRAWFCPGQAPRLVHRIAAAIAQSRDRVRIASPVLTSGPVLATLAEVAAEGRLDIAGVLDATQMNEVYGQWGQQHSWKLDVLSRVVEAIPFTGKQSTPYAPGSVHDYMHAKIVVADDIVFAGSFNLSHSGEMNAENVVEMLNPDLAQQLAGYVDQTRALYPPLPPP